MKSAKKQAAKNRQNYLFGFLFLTGVILLAVSWLLAKCGQIGTTEAAIFGFFNGWSEPLPFIFLVITVLGTFGAAVALTAILIMLKKNTLAFEVLLAGALSWLAATAIKDLIIRQRPYELLNNVNTLENKDFTMGFPSGHTALATALAVILLTQTKIKQKWLVVAALLLVAVSRMVVGVHAPLDIIGGFGVGVIVAVFVKFISDSYLRKESLIKNGHKTNVKK